MRVHFVALLVSAPLRLFLRTRRPNRIPQVALHDSNAPVPVPQMVRFPQRCIDKRRLDHRRTLFVRKG